MKNLLILGCAFSFSCASATDSKTPPNHFSFLQERDLSRFEQSLAFDVQKGEVNDWTKLGQSWVAFANCQTFPELDFEKQRIAFLEASLRSESARRELRALVLGAENVETLAEALLSPDYFKREGLSEEEQIRWPGGDERWSDERPASLNIEGECESFYSKLEKSKTKLEEEGVPSIATHFETAYFESILKTNKIAEAISEDERQGAIGETIFKLNLEGIRYFAGRRRIFENESRALKKQRATRSHSKDEDEALAKEQKVADEFLLDYSHKIESLASSLQALVPVEGLRFSPTQLAVARSVLAMLAIEDGRFEDAQQLLISKHASIPDFDDAQFAWLYRYLDIRVNSALANYALIESKYDNTLPNRRSKYYGPYVYRLAFALKHAGAEDRFYGTVKSAFRDRAYKSDPFLRALYFELLKSLVRTPFGPEVSEVLEELGPRGETFERAEELARVALDEGHPKHASDASSWLLANHKNAKFHPRYHAIRALAAFQNDDEKTFLSALKSVIYRPKELVDALKAERRPVFFQHADVELARVLQRLIPEMAEWGDSKAVQERRQKWLQIIVKVTQEFLHNDKDSLSRNALVDVYRLASGLLKDDPRGYAERVGESKLRPLVLGQVVMEASTLDPFEPGIDLGIPIVFSTTLVPGVSPISEWKDRFPEEDSGNE